MHQKKKASLQKITILLFILLNVLHGRAQIKKDTIFLIHDKIQKIYIEPNKESGYYISLTAFFYFNVKGSKKPKKKTEKENRKRKPKKKTEKENRKMGTAISIS
ncbi:hypothetical protein [Flavobacterium sp. WV_118_3]|uniref:hypothetical protein n=1 Tax=Flavobacterium sp. WV_118_3 TaxID=3151764 RepID=UPI00321AA416